MVSKDAVGGNQSARCYVCGEKVPKEHTALMRYRVPSGLVRTPSPFTYRIVRKCVPYCGAESDPGRAGEGR